MTRPPTQSPQTKPINNSSSSSSRESPKIPIEIVSDEEMALIEAALTASRSSLSPTQFQRSPRSVGSITRLSKRRLSTEPSSSGDIEDAGGDFRGTQKRNRVIESFLHRFRRKRGLYVTDITSTEWCEKQMEFSLLFGKPEISKAMKAGIARHTVLEEEVVKRVTVRLSTNEDVWALKFMNFMTGVNQLLFEGLTRELPLLGFVEGVWMVGVVDEIRMPLTETENNPTFVDTKTRQQATLPAEPQRRNGRLQLMCYKYLWDNLVADNFPFRLFFDYFSLNPHSVLSEEIVAHACKSGFPAETLDELARYFQNTCCILPPAHEQLLLRYELQEDHSLLGEDQFTYDSDWLKGKIQCSLEFWLGEREAKFAPDKERWKCGFCQYASVCPINADSISKHC
ncbi:Exonuclease [Actinidia chinensis var. chinensis]|uniref:Exonuclease n=1 Tax=Actinidia chinensis var. chinensis TaxID=1590841 RepID=A0A2R6PQW9_ACTCC|nr:Exonuclease [Actinidia chinensis var. chinensis]